MSRESIVKTLSFHRGTSRIATNYRRLVLPARETPLWGNLPSKPIFPVRNQIQTPRVLQFSGGRGDVQGACSTGGSVLTHQAALQRRWLIFRWSANTLVSAQPPRQRLLCCLTACFCNNIFHQDPPGPKWGLERKERYPRQMDLMREP